MHGETWGTHPLRLAWRALRLLYDDLFPFVGLSLLTWAGGLSIVLAWPAWIALHEVARLAIEGYAVHSRHWRTALRTYFTRAWAVGGITLIVTAVLVSNVFFYGRQEGTLWQYVTVFWLWLLAFWALTALYVAPMTVLQEETRPWHLVRNAFYLAALRPLHTLVAIIWLTVVQVLSLIIPLLLLVTPAYVAIYTTLLARQLILDIQRQHPPPPDTSENGGT